MHFLSQKELLELKFWIMEPRATRDALQAAYLRAFGLEPALHPSENGVRSFDSILEIGTGPYWGMLPYVRAQLRIGVDPLYQAYHDLGLLDMEGRGDIRFFPEPFELWDTTDTFDLILCADALDHGGMGFGLLPKISGLLKPGGEFYLHVHLRPEDMLNLIHDHSLTVEGLQRNLRFTDLIEIDRCHYDHDVDGGFCEALIGRWRKPA